VAVFTGVKRGRVKGKSKMVLVYLIFALVVARHIWLSYNRKLDDAETMAWATRCEPIVFISEHPFDTTVEARAKAAIEALKECGNKFLTERDVWVYVYRVDVPMFGEVKNPNHAQWHEIVMREVLERRAQWRALKSDFIKNEAGRVFAKQV